MKELTREYGSLALSAIGGAAVFVCIAVAFLSKDGIFAALVTRCMAFWF